MKKLLTLIFCIQVQCFLLAQTIEKIEPPFWFAGMIHSTVQIMVYGKNIQQLEPQTINSKAIITKVHQVENPNYLFIDLDLSKVQQPENIQIDWVQSGVKIITTTYEIKPRTKGRKGIETFDSKDVIYLITPDRFANGDLSNDIIPGMLENHVNNEVEYARHGGDLQGIINHLDYIDEMGFTAIWLNPILENNQPQWSYHGYATTDYYNIDRRFGTNELYKELSIKAKEKGIGIIMDMVANHCGHKHWWMDDLPTKDWVHFQNEKYQETNHRRTTLLDPYAAPIDRDLMVKGWFVLTMPDLNQNNPYLAKYLIQNSIWWIEFADLYGIRQDTYSYPYKDFMKDWTCSILEEYPDFNIVGEEWSTDPSIISYWQKGKQNPDEYQSCLRSIMDFPLNSILVNAFKEDESWAAGLIKLYENLSNDYQYSNPQDILVFADNHDMNRVSTVAELDIPIIKMAMAYILTTRGIPQIFYGTEIMMSHIGTDSHGAIRANFPGGWANDTINAFSGEGLTEGKIELQQWMKNLINWRKSKSVIHDGKLMHFTPQDGTYVYFRYNSNENVMVIFNKNDNEYQLNLNRFKDRMLGYNTMKNIFNNKSNLIENHINLPPRSVQIFEFDKF